jgi:hypothetical protein
MKLRNYVAKHSRKVNRAKVFTDRKKELKKRGKSKNESKNQKCYTEAEMASKRDC